MFHPSLSLEPTAGLPWFAREKIPWTSFRALPHPPAFHDAGTAGTPRHTFGVPLVSRGAGTAANPRHTFGVPLVRSRLRLSTSGRGSSRLPRRIAEAPGVPGYRYSSWEADDALPCTGSIEDGSGPSGTVSLKPATPATPCPPLGADRAGAPQSDQENVVRRSRPF